jgi:ubiquinol-cytochrome c reductase iron-sulfur subunit
MSNDMNRRDFIGLAFGGFAAIGGIASLVAMKKTWDPLPSVVAAGVTTVDLSPIAEGEMKTVNWRGKPVFVLRKSSDMQECDDRDVVAGNDRYTVVIGICTHLGCIPAWKKSEKLFKCACHGGEFDACGKNTFGPPPRPFDIPPFKLDGSTLVLGEEGAEYKKLQAQNA